MNLENRKVIKASTGKSTSPRNSTNPDIEKFPLRLMNYKTNTITIRLDVLARSDSRMSEFYFVGIILASVYQSCFKVLDKNISI